ncbi:VIT1/CCC1 transporter family protein [Chitinophaga sancti]|uniref:TIGR00267 family protein n=1 Tax=Chitinophaga sancti TaxID=1004 RepID=A0A1K1Q923_9BACT|nr:VIT1/CCC1 transporter family protein [Chitinophaga sancti]WQD61239.1 VIT1/CCC1 transporter family protein [Chitinophaga sancti]WQG86634.1 VIT1/CCC1 transporter family protein [Chitinophaga sancti]SFW56179.1 TIGR00267 family protein [Chitinophaga sancti]
MHQETHINSSNFVRDIIIGMSDGLTVPFALTAGLSGVLDTNHLIIVSGLSEIAAGCISMGLGGFLAGQTEIEHYDSELKREYEEVEKVPEIERREVEAIFIDMGVDKELSKQVTLQISQDKDKWVDFMMRFELGLDKPDKDRAIKSAVTIAFSYLAGGFIPLFPYLVTTNNQQGFYFSCIITVIALLVFGYFKSKVTGQPLMKGTLKVALTGIIAAVAAFALAKLVS